jgi:anti-sigma regulatory factor (Ser/Thr protein kinase)
MLAVGEAAANAVEYGRSASAESYFTVSCLATPHKLSVSVSDHGPGFNLDDVPDSPPEPLFERGRGIHCMNAVMDEVGYSFDGGTTVRMMKLGG